MIIKVKVNFWLKLFLKLTPFPVPLSGRLYSSYLLPPWGKAGMGVEET